MSSHRLTPEQTAKGMRAAQHGRKWFKKTLLGIFKGEIECSATQLNALKTYADSMGWVAPKRAPKQPGKAAKPKPVLTDDLISRLGIQAQPIQPQIIANIDKAPSYVWRVPNS